MVPFPEGITKEHLQKFYCKGDVLFWENFPGQKITKDAHLVLLTNCIKNQFIFVRATKQKQYYFGSSSSRISHDIVFIKAGETPLFSEDTVLDLTWMNFLSVEELCKLFGSLVKKEGRLSSDIIKRIDDCVRCAVTISPRNQNLILQS